MPLIQAKCGDYRATGLITADDILATAAAIATSRAYGTDLIKCPDDAKALFVARLRHLEHEEFHVAFLSGRHHIIAVESMFRGSIDGSEVHPREVVKAALRYNASAILCSHNHPSGGDTPSAADRAVTTRLKQALGLVEIRLLDHLVIGNPGVTSLASMGWI